VERSDRLGTSSAGTSRNPEGVDKAPQKDKKNPASLKKQDDVSSLF